MTSFANPVQKSEGEIYSFVAEQMIEMRDSIANKVRNQAKLNMDVRLSSPDITQKARDLVSHGFHEYESEARRRFQSPPWSEFATMILTTSRVTYFSSSSVLLGEVIDLLKGKSMPCNNVSSDSEWDWTPDGIKSM
ncbi:MAG: hypothetical protein JSS10_09625 [Verrucomicrobia bacterium]|nr:hypothetical protein [Verrucomicrobiota bacterium]